jgi:hypothetical protein
MAKLGVLPVTVRATSGGDTVVIPAPPAGKQISVMRGSVHNRAGATSPLVSLKAASAAPLRWSAVVPAGGGTAYFDFGVYGWPLAPGAPLQVNLSEAGDVDVNVTEYTLEGA